jgi:methyl-accepting chemotaxis protein
MQLCPLFGLNNVTAVQTEPAMKIAPRQITERLNPLNLRAKLSLGFLLVLCSTVIVGTTSLFTEKHDGAAIERLLDTETRIGDLTDNSEGTMRLTRQNEKDFLLQYRRIGFDEAKARYATLLRVEVTEIHQNMDAVRHLVADESVIRQTRAIDQAMDQFEKKFLVTIELIKQRGFFEVGVEGQFRNRIHEVETILTQQRAESLLVDMLTLRRKEKDFLLGYREQDALALKEGAVQFQRRIASSNLQPDLKDALRHLISDYQALFEEYVQLNEQITTETETYRTVVHGAEPLLGELRTWALQRADALDQDESANCSRHRRYRHFARIASGISDIAQHRGRSQRVHGLRQTFGSRRFGRANETLQPG